MKSEIPTRFRVSSNQPVAHSRSTSAQSSVSSDLSAFVQQPNVVIVDVRTPEEHYEARINEAKLIPVQTIPERLDDLPEDFETPIVVFCKIGQRSGLAKNFLEQVGYNNVFNGINLETVSEATGADIVYG